MTQLTSDPSRIGADAAAGFVDRFLPGWLDIAIAPGTGPAPVIEQLPDEQGPTTTLAQARTAFMLAHLGRLSGREDLIDASARITAFLLRFLRRSDGGCVYAVNPDGTPIETEEARLCRCYDQTFVLLALVTLQKARPDAVSDADIARCWSFIDKVLTNRDRAALWEDDRMAASGARPGDLRAQNPHMHMLEAVLQCLELTGDPVWKERARFLVAARERYFIDPATGAVREFVGHDFTPLDTPDGRRREPGHQYEWAWLLMRHAELTGDREVLNLVGPMAEFALEHGWRKHGPLAGTLFDALDEAGAVVEPTHLLWPLTEAGKYFAARARLDGDSDAADRALALAGVIFTRYFRDFPDPAWVNQFDGDGEVTWEAGLTRLLYHVGVFVSEGAAAGLWPLTLKYRPSR